MSANTTIEWCDFSFNIVWGCSKKSPGCENCYAIGESKRRGFPSLWGTERMGATRRTFGDAHWAEPLRWNRRAKKEGVRRRVFCSSMADVCDDHPITRAQLPPLFSLIRATEWLDWLLLTKRPEEYPNVLPADFSAKTYPNVWLGVSVENQKYADERVPLLLQQDAAVHFLSCEPLLGSIDLTRINQDDSAYGLDALTGEEHYPRSVRTGLYSKVDWVIVGGESGPKARRMDIEWVTDLVAQCDFAGVACFVKQLGARPVMPNDAQFTWAGGTPPIHAKYEPAHQGELCRLVFNSRKGNDPAEWPEELRVRQFPKAGV